jgi:hypothetical protein
MKQTTINDCKIIDLRKRNVGKSPAFFCFWGIKGKRPRRNRASAKKTALIEAGILMRERYSSIQAK